MNWWTVALQLLGMIAWRRGRMEEAEKLLRQAEELKVRQERYPNGSAGAAGIVQNLCVISLWYGGEQGPDGYVKACLAVVRKCRSAPTEEVRRAGQQRGGGRGHRLDRHPSSVTITAGTASS